MHGPTPATQKGRAEEDMRMDIMGKDQETSSVRAAAPRGRLEPPSLLLSCTATGRRTGSGCHVSPSLSHPLFGSSGRSPFTSLSPLARSVRCMPGCRWRARRLRAEWTKGRPGAIYWYCACVDHQDVHFAWDFHMEPLNSTVHRLLPMEQQSDFLTKCTPSSAWELRA